MLFTSFAIAVLLGLAAAIPIAEPIPDAPSGHEIEIQDVKYAGSGCPAGSVSKSLSDDLTVMTLLFDNYIVSTGPQVAITESRKNCQLNIKLKYPQGWQYSVFSADFRGFAAIAAHSKGQCKATYYFSGQTAQGESTLTINGPWTGDYLKHDEAGIESRVWSPCGEQGMLNVNSQVRIIPFNTNAENLMTVDSTDVKFAQLLYFQWRKC